MIFFLSPQNHSLDWQEQDSGIWTAALSNKQILAQIPNGVTAPK